MIVDLNDLTADFIDTSIEVREWAWAKVRLKVDSPKCIVLRYQGSITGAVFYTVDGKDIVNTYFATKPPWGVPGHAIENVPELRAKNAKFILQHFFDTLNAETVSVQAKPGNKRMQSIWLQYTGQAFVPGNEIYEGILTRKQYLAI